MKRNYGVAIMSDLIAVVLWIVALTVPAQPVSAQPTVSAEACIVMEAMTGEVLYEKNADEKRPMASTTKIMTTLLCLESGDLDTEFVVDSDAIHVEGSSMGLVEGDIVTKRALCYGMLLPSGNDAAGATAVKFAGSYAAFAERMNQKAASLGMSQTHFVTPSGLHDPEHYSTAYDMAILTAAALQNETFCEICSQSEAKVRFGNPPYDRWLTNSNKLLDMDDRVIGVKTGFTDEAGRCLVSAQVRNGVTLICVTLDAPDDWNDHLKLYDACFAQIEPMQLAVESWDLPVVGSNTDFVTVEMDSELTIGTTEDTAPELTYEIETAPFLYAPITSGQEVGIWRAMCGERIVAGGTLIATEEAAYSEPEELDCELKRSSGIRRIWHRIKELVKR